MKFKFLSVLIICLMMFSTVGVASAASPLFVNNVNDGSYGGIVVNDLTIDGLQKAINNATGGDTIIINGSIDEKGTVKCNKNLLIMGQNNCSLTGVRWSCNKDIEFRCIKFCDYYFDNDCGIINAYSPIAVNNCSFINNRIVNGGIQSDYGCAIHSNDSVEVSSSTFVNNVISGEGGAIYTNGNISVSNSLFDENKASCNGGAIYANGFISISGSNFTKNYADSNGGALFSFNGSVNIIGSKFDNNSAHIDGGAIYASKNVDVRGSSFSSNSVQGAVVNCEGGAIKCVGGKVVLSNSSFVLNSAEDYGGAIWSNRDVNVSDCSFKDNVARSDEGGAIYCDDSSVNIVGSTFVRNNAKSEGGAIWSNCNVTVDDSSFNNNCVDGASVMQCEGGAIYADGGDSPSDQKDGAVVLTNSIFIGNSAYDYGGAVWSDDGVTVHGCLFKNNYVKDNRGGAIYMDDSCNLRVSDSSFYGNSANDKGGAIYCEGNSAHIYLDSYNSFENNSAKEGSVVFTDGYFDTIQCNWWGSVNPDFNNPLLVEWKAWPRDNVKHSDSNPLSYNPNL